MNEERRAAAHQSVNQASGNRPDADRWSEIRHRLEEAGKAIERGFQPTPEQRKKILKARAMALAREPEKEEIAEEHLPVVEFLLAAEKYAFESAHVREVYPLKDFSSIPCTPPFILGVANVRGRMVSIIDIKKFFDLPEKGLGQLNKIIILRHDEMEFGILADAVLGVLSIPLNRIQPPLPTLSGIRAEYLRGVTKEGLAILDAARLLADKKIVVHEEVVK